MVASDMVRGPGLPETHIAIMKSDLKELAQLLEGGASPDEADDCGRTALWLACRNAEFMMAEKLIKVGANINAESHELKWTPLMCACGEKAKHTECMRMLLAEGADPNQADYKGWTPLMRCALAGNLASIKMLLEHGADHTVAITDGLIDKPTNAAGMARLASQVKCAEYLEKVAA